MSHYKYNSSGRLKDSKPSMVSREPSKEEPETKMKKTEQMPPNAGEKQGSPAQGRKIVIVTWTFANIRSGVGNAYPVVTTVKQGDKLIVLGEVGTWFNVRVGNDQEGWIDSRVVKE